MVSEIRMTKLKYPNIFLSDIDEIPSITIDNFLIELELGPPSPEIQEVARKELRESPEFQEEAISRLRELLRAEPDLHCPLDNDAWLIRFLRPCKYYPESACKLVKNYYKFRAKCPHLYVDLKPSNERNIFKQDIFNILPNRDQCGRRILILEVGKKWKVNKCSINEIFKGCVLYMEAAIMEPTTQIAGAVMIFDMEGFSFQHAMQVTPSFAKMLVDLLQEAVPLRIKTIHVVNEPYIIHMVFKLFKPFLKEKLQSRLIFHGADRNSLHQYISPNCLPPSHGGTSQAPKVSGNHWLQLLVTGEKEYDTINSYGYNKK